MRPLRKEEPAHAPSLENAQFPSKHEDEYTLHSKKCLGAYLGMSAASAHRRAMRKSLVIAIAVEAVVLVTAVALSVACIGFGIGERNEVLNLVMILLLVVVSGVMMLAYWMRSMQRDEMVRRFFISPKWVYNHEIGYAPLDRVVPDGDAYRFVTFAADALAKMSYGGFEVADAPEDFKPEYLIDSRVFQYHLISDPESTESTEGAEEGVVVDRWQGTLQRIEHDIVGRIRYEDVGAFENARDLAILLEDSDAFDPAFLQEDDVFGAGF